VGLSHDDRDASIADVAFGLRTRTETSEIEVLERGVVRAAVGAFAPGDRLRVAVRDGVVEYFRNGTLLWTSSGTPAYPLVADAAFGGPGRVSAQLRGALGRVVEWAPASGVRAGSTTVTAGRAAVLEAEGAAPVSAVEAVLAGEAAVGLSADTVGCDFCLARTAPGRVSVRHAGICAGPGTWRRRHACASS